MSKKIWIAGASSGIGRALAIKFANEGWQVAASARRKNLLQELNNNNLNIHSFPLDVKDESNTKNVFQDIIGSPIPYKQAMNDYLNTGNHRIYMVVDFHGHSINNSRAKIRFIVKYLIGKGTNY